MTSTPIDIRTDISIDISRSPSSLPPLLSLLIAPGVVRFKLARASGASDDDEDDGNEDKVVDDDDKTSASMSAALGTELDDNTSLATRSFGENTIGVDDAFDGESLSSSLPVVIKDVLAFASTFASTAGNVLSIASSAFWLGASGLPTAGKTTAVPSVDVELPFMLKMSLALLSSAGTVVSSAVCRVSTSMDATSVFCDCAASFDSSSSHIASASQVLGCKFDEILLEATAATSHFGSSVGDLGEFV